MSADYTPYLEDILEELWRTCPTTAAKLETLRFTYDTTAAFHAAFILLCLLVDADRYGVHTLDCISYDQVKRYIYFEYTQDRADARERFAEILHCFCAEVSEGDAR